MTIHTAFRTHNFKIPEVGLAMAPTAKIERFQKTVFKSYLKFYFIMLKSYISNFFIPYFG